MSQTPRLTRQDLVDLCEIYKAKSLEEHTLFRQWRDRALAAEKLLAIYEPGDEPTSTQESLNTEDK